MGPPQPHIVLECRFTKSDAPPKVPHTLPRRRFAHPREEGGGKSGLFAIEMAQESAKRTVLVARALADRYLAAGCAPRDKLSVQSHPKSHSARVASRPTCSTSTSSAILRCAHRGLVYQGCSINLKFRGFSGGVRSSCQRFRSSRSIPRAFLHHLNE